MAWYPPKLQPVVPIWPPTGPVAHEGCHLQGQVRVESVLAVQTVHRGGMLVVPGRLVHRIHTDHLQVSAVDLGRQRTHHAAVFVLEKAPTGRGEHYDRKPAWPNANSSIFCPRDGLCHVM